MLDLVRMSSRQILPPGGVELYRHIALLTELSEGDEILDVACGPGATLEYFVQEYGVHGFGVDSDPAMVELGEGRVREAGLTEEIHLQQAPLDALPYRDEIFDVTIGEMGVSAHTEPGPAIRELVRVTRPGGSVVLVQLVWKAPVDERRRKILSEHLGARPLMLMELKRILREAGVTGLHTEDWSDEETAFRSQITKPFPDFTELFSLPEKLGILRRAWGRWGWEGVKTAMLREREVHRLLTKERVIGLDLLLGTKEGAGVEEGTEPSTGAEERAVAEAGDEAGGENGEQLHEETADLPLFSHEGGGG
ncbi:MAG: methyltransferase domain-containing protein [Gemmatimonadetes bacterium]|nr:methyltransferase domain-containing protein [Gemmatimonadota bacterium]NIU37238.1 methyltransferase domain-containing protein [Gemmatimonadota bacterium]NIV84179.1 methyltransferase domain-containing protein [Gemmatimonadota bacterium]NIX41197.1 methyltransferase domain-containing protein [Gemmatimonadota bacterium]NIY40894.1 methyltransferase domain-containing protein [Gemmatimonadota bacterium]